MRFGSLPPVQRTFPLIVILVVWALSVLLWISPGLTKPDGAGYFVYLPSTWFDRDLLFLDEWQELNMVQNGRILHKEITATDHLGNHWTVGSAMYWFPSFVLGDGLRAMIPSLRLFPRNGYSLPYNLPVVFASAVAGLGTLLVGYSIARRLTSPFAATLAAMGTWFGTSLLWYSLRQSILSHAIAAFSCALTLAAALRLSENGSRAWWALAGLAGGFSFAVRPQNAPVLLLPFFFVKRPLPSQLSVFTLSAAAAVTPQLIVSSFIYGNPLAFLWGAGARPFAAFERVWWWEPLLSWYHGLIPWTPFALAGLIGITLLWRTNRRLSIACGFLFLTQWLINAVLERSFWGAYSFGQRRFDGCTIVFLIGAAVLFSSLPRWLGVALVVLCCGWTISIFFSAIGGLDLSAYYTPSELLQIQGEALRQVTMFFRGLGSVPDRAVPVVVVLLLVSALFWVALILPLWRKRPALLAAVAGAYFLAMIVWFASSGGRHNLAQYASLITANREMARLPGGPDVRIGLLTDELRYLRKSGRERLALETERELATLLQSRKLAQEQLPIP